MCPSVCARDEKKRKCIRRRMWVDIVQFACRWRGRNICPSMHARDSVRVRDSIPIHNAVAFSLSKDEVLPRRILITWYFVSSQMLWCVA